MGDEKSEYPPLLVGFLTEIVGTAALLYLGCMGCLEMHVGSGPTVPAFTFGLSILAIVQTFHHFGPVHINPAVSIGFLIVGKMPWLNFIIYIFGQYIGALLGYTLLWVVTPRLTTPTGTEMKMCFLTCKYGLNPLQCFLNEILGSMFMMLLVLGAVDEKNDELKDSIALRIGMGVTGIIFAMEPFTGAGLNPARSLPPALFYMNFQDHWVYELGPALGMALAAVIYMFIFDEGHPYSLHTWLVKRGE